MTVNAAQDPQDALDRTAFYNRCAREVKDACTHRDAALRNVETLSFQLDRQREALRVAQAQLAREQQATREVMKRTLELHRIVQRFHAVKRQLSPAQWGEAVEFAKGNHPDLFGNDEDF